ncbi:hypothetical protein RB596_008860 [Gaeumannomyces avenae]
MAFSPQLTIAKASLLASLVRAEPTACSRDEIEHFHMLLDSAIAQCSPANVQKCKNWTLRHIAQSTARVAALGKFLAALAVSSVASERHHNKKSAAPANNKPPVAPRKPSAKRKRLHLLYIISDVLHHTRTVDKNDTFAAGLEQTLPAIFKSASSFSKSPKHIKKLHDLVSLWEERSYLLSPEIPAKLREAIAAGSAAISSSNVAEADGQRGGKAGGAPAPAKEAPFLLPSTHGDPSTAWYDLPAANWLHVLEPNSTRAVDPARIKPLELNPGAADVHLVEAVKSLLADVDRQYSSDVGVIGAADENDPSVSIDQMGERVELDEITGKILGGTTYYGWSRDFCLKMKARRKQGRAGGRGGGSRSRSRDSRDSSGSTRSRGRDVDRDRGGGYNQGRERSRGRDRSSGGSRARSSSRPVFKRRRVSPSQSRSQSMDRGGIGRGRSRSRSYSPDHYRRRSRSRSGYAPSKSRSRSRDHRGGMDPSPGYSPPPAAATGPVAPFFLGMPPNMPPNPQFPPQPPMPPMPLPPPHMMPAMPMPPHQFPGQAFGAYPPQPPFQPYPNQWPAAVPVPHPHGLPNTPMGIPMQAPPWLPPRPDQQGGWIGGWGAQPQQQSPQSPAGSPPAYQHHRPQQGGYQHQYGRGGGTGGYRGQSPGRGGYNSGHGRGW